MAQDTGLVKRGVVLLALVLLVGGAVLLIIFRGQPRPAAQEAPRAEPLIGALVVPSAGFPNSVHWLALHQLTQNLPSRPGFDIRYTATQVLAKRGSTRLPLDVLAEMLDENQQLRNHRVRLKDGRIVADEATAQLVILNALRSFQEWHAAVGNLATDQAGLGKIHLAIEKLAGHANPVVKNEAVRVKMATRPK